MAGEVVVLDQVSAAINRDWCRVHEQENTPFGCLLICYAELARLLCRACSAP